MRTAYTLIGLGLLLMVLALVMPSLAGEAPRVELASLALDSTETVVERLQAGEILDCPGCDLSGADLSHTCVKEKNLSGANFDNVTALYMCMSYANFSGATFRNANLTGVNLGHSDLSGADLTGAILDIASLIGTDLETVKGLTQEQLNVACADETTKLPEGFTHHLCI
jgi:uncharacterized protein YjbI with pentapeptide repeats